MSDRITSHSRDSSAARARVLQRRRRFVNETFGRAVFGHMDPAGHTIKPDFPDAKEQLIVGVVKDSKYFTLGEKQRLAAYEPYFISEEPTNLQFLIRTGGSPSRYVSRSTIFWAAWIRPLPWKQSR